MKRCTTGERKNTLGVTSRDILFTHQQNGRRTTQQPLDWTSVGARSHLRYGLPDFEICLLDWLHPTLGCQQRHQCCDMLNNRIIRVTFFFSFHGHVTISPIYIHTCGGSASPCLRFSYWYDCTERPTACKDFTPLTAGAMYASHTYRINHDQSNRRATLLYTPVDLSMAESKMHLRFLSHRTILPHIA